MRDPYKKPSNDAQTALNRLESLTWRLKNAPVAGLDECWMEIDQICDQLSDLIDEVNDYTDI